jgi:hypothetical protein
MPEPLDYESRQPPADVRTAPPLLEYATPRPPRRTRIMPLIGAVIAGGFALLFAVTTMVAIHEGDGPAVAVLAPLTAYAGMWVRFAASSRHDR